MKPSPSVVTVILNWNQPEHTLKCIEYVRRQTAQSTIVVVDNGSTDDSVRQFQSLGPAVRLLALARNEGFAEGMNVGLRIAVDENFDFVWLLNNDVFAEPTCLERLVAAMADPDVVMVGPRLFWTNGNEQPVGARARWQSGAFDSLMASELVSCSGHDHWLMGAAPVVRVATLRAVGLFDPSFFAYMEDADLGVRLARVGAVRTVLDASGVHIGGATSGGEASALSQYLMMRNTWLFLTRNAPPGSMRARWFRFTAHALRLAELYQVRGWDKVARGALAGVTAARRDRYGPPGSLSDCGWLERFLFTHPTRFSRALDLLASGFETAWTFIGRGRPVVADAKLVAPVVRGS